MNNISKIEKCTCCSACYNACPVNAIRLNSEKTFYSFEVDESVCSECGLCLSVCPVQNVLHRSVISAFAGWHKNSDTVQNSSSGGAFRAIADYVLASGGVVFGAAYSEDCREVIVCSTDRVDVSHLQKSKYVESRVGNAFSEVKKQLLADRMVLYCGTPCQIQGLIRYLQREYDNLITVDFACGGLPSHKIYADYLEILENKYKAKVASVDFRPKTHGWKQYSVLVQFQNGRVYNRLGEEDPYLNAYIHGGNTVRNNCLTCEFSDNHASDITLADFWKYRSLTDLDNDSGISLILCNSDKGITALNAVRESMEFIPLDIEEASYNNRKTICDDGIRELHNQFVSECLSDGIFAANQKHFPLTLKKRIKKIVKRNFFRKRN